ncbi:S-adenosylmethionine decarboxylase proenzyme [Diaphorina citri]|uniref:S-adenosylmethionine decarboxylase proenzyme n=1 Tax=Diaphorina citri TaxID=121845 RepID=A0A3Q0ILD7_DIACI|nr:S-adenosylmethionine decarboxylase proenzyme [Diaphorina citri]
MFIAKRRFILKTCGTTTPLQCLKSLLTLVEQYAGFDQVEDIFYSRKNFKRPDLQKKDYRSFDQEVELLNALFLRGHAYCLGSPKRPDCWYLYTLNPIQDVNNNMDLGCHGNSQDEDDIPDQTLEILMHDLDPKVMQLFTKAQSTSATDATEDVNNNMDLGCHGNSQDEDDIPDQTLEILMHDLDPKVMQLFTKAQSTSATDATETSEASRIPRSLKEVSWFGNKWRQEDIETCRTKNYDFTYTFYSKFPS